MVRSATGMLRCLRPACAAAAGCNATRLNVCHRFPGTSGLNTKEIPLDCLTDSS